MTDTPDPRIVAVLGLRTLDFFDGLTATELEPIAAISERATHEEGAIVFEQGDDGDHLFIITGGSVAVQKDGVRVATLSEGDCFGEMAVLDQTKRSATIRVAEQGTTLVSIRRGALMELLELYPSVAFTIARTLARRVRESS